MVDLKQQEAAQLAALRLQRNVPEIKMVVQWLHTLELQAIELLIACKADEFADRAARVQVLRTLQSRITAPTFSETQARYTVTTDA